MNTLNIIYCRVSQLGAHAQGGGKISFQGIRRASISITGILSIYCTPATWNKTSVIREPHILGTTDLLHTVFVNSTICLCCLLNGLQKFCYTKDTSQEMVQESHNFLVHTFLIVSRICILSNASHNSHPLVAPTSYTYCNFWATNLCVCDRINGLSI